MTKLVFMGPHVGHDHGFADGFRGRIDRVTAPDVPNNARIAIVACLMPEFAEVKEISKYL
jgi:hypothetical protein